MATHPSAVRNGIADFVLGQCAGGDLLFLAAGGEVIAVLALSTPAFGMADKGIAEAYQIRSDPSANGGRIARAVLRSSIGIVKVMCTVTEIDGAPDPDTGRPGDIEVESLIVMPGQTVSIKPKSLFYQAPP